MEFTQLELKVQSKIVLNEQIVSPAKNQREGNIGSRQTLLPTKILTAIIMSIIIDDTVPSKNQKWRRYIDFLQKKRSKKLSFAIMYYFVVYDYHIGVVAFVAIVANFPRIEIYEPKLDTTSQLLEQPSDALDGMISDNAHYQYSYY